MCINGRRYICCSAWYVVSNERDDPIPLLVQHIGKHGGKVMYFGSGVCEMYMCLSRSGMRREFGQGEYGTCVCV